MTPDARAICADGIDSAVGASPAFRRDEAICFVALAAKPQARRMDSAKRERIAATLYEQHGRDAIGIAHGQELIHRYAEEPRKAAHWRDIRHRIEALRDPIARRKDDRPALKSNILREV